MYAADLTDADVDSVLSHSLPDEWWCGYSIDAIATGGSTNSMNY